MAILEKIWELLGVIFGGILHRFERVLTAVFGSSNAKIVKRLQTKVDAINSLEDKFKAMTDEELRNQTELFRKRLKNGETLDDLLVEAFAACRESGRRYLGMRHYDVQLIGGMVLHSGAIAEMVTGEGKTLVATLPAYLNAIPGKGVHVVTVNDYLARRDMEWMAPLYMGLGLTVGAIQGNMDPSERQKSYACEITYGTNNEFGFDYLRDNMRPAARDDNRFPKRLQQAQGRLNYAIIDEVDNILIDEARTPLIISGPANQTPQRYMEANRIAASLTRETHFTVNEKDHTVALTDEGVREAERLAGVDTFYTAANMDWPHLIDNALKAHYLYKRDVNYVVQEGKVIIVDEFTGRLMDGRQWSDGLHQAVEAKEGVKIKEETQTLATITLQNFFKLYGKISGMTGTGMTEANEFYKIYKLDVIAIPTNRNMQRIEFGDAIYSTERSKFEAIADEIEQMHRFDIIKKKDGKEVSGTIKSETDSQITVEVLEGARKQDATVARSEVDSIQYHGRPILVGTVSIEKSERLSALLDKRGIKHQVLNAKHHKREAEIVAQAGRIGAVTIATNMAGRGTDIILGGNPETMAWASLQDRYASRLDVPREVWESLTKEISDRENMKVEGEKVRKLGGLHVIGTERHEARRIDLQLRGRCGRQGDPGSSRFFLSLEDDIMRIFAGPWVRKFLETIGWQEGEAIESRTVSRRIESAQKKIEERNFEIRKNLLEYDEVMDEQRKRIYTYRQNILDGKNCRDLVIQMIDDQVKQALDSYLSPMFGPESFASFASNRLGCPLEARIFKGQDYANAMITAHREAERNAETDIISLIDENLPEDDETEWNWRAMADFANRRWNLGVHESTLKKVGRDSIAEFLITKANEAIAKIDLQEGSQLLDEHIGLKSAARWAEARFTVQVAWEKLKDQDASSIRKQFVQAATEAYDMKEAQYPIMVGAYRFSKKNGTQVSMDGDSLLAWFENRMGETIDREAIQGLEWEKLRDHLLEVSRRNQVRAREARQSLRGRINKLDDAGVLPATNQDEPKFDELKAWLGTFGYEWNYDRVVDLDDEELFELLLNGLEDHFHPEMRRMERFVLLEVVDSAWKDHLLAMDYLRTAVGQRGMASLDPKVEYKREGMRMFEELWRTIQDRSCDLIFKMEQLDEGFVRTTFVETSARHDAIQASASQIAREQQQAIEASGGAPEADALVEPIRNTQPKVGRNDPCPCGSGKKYKQCCMKNQRDIA